MHLQRVKINSIKNHFHNYPLPAEPRYFFFKLKKGLKKDCLIKRPRSRIFFNIMKQFNF